MEIPSIIIAILILTPFVIALFLIFTNRYFLKRNET